MKKHNLKFIILKILFTYYFFRGMNRRKLKRKFKKFSNGIYIIWLVISLYLFLVDRETFYIFTSVYWIIIFYVLVNTINFILRYIIEIVLFVEYLSVNSYGRINKDFVKSVNINAISLRKRELITVGEYLNILKNMFWWRV